MQDSLYTLVKKLTLKNNIRLHQEELKLQLKSHPSYPSLHSITGVLDHFSIPNIAVDLAANKNVLDQLPKCFIAGITTESRNALVLIEKFQKYIKVRHDNGETEKLTPELFLERWGGIIVAIEKNESVRESKDSFGNQITTGSYIILALAVIGYLVYTLSDLFAGFHFTLSVFGVILSIFIVKHELGFTSGFENRFCNLTERTSCDAILNSSGATLFGFLKLSDLSIVAFTSCCLCWALFAVIGVSNFTMMSIVTLLAFPFTVYSIYYQYKVVKKWCPLCLGVAGILLLQATSLLLIDFSEGVLFIGLYELWILLASFALTTIVWRLLKPLVKTRKEYKTLEVSHYKFKRSFTIFNSLLTQSETLSSPTIKGEMVFGNENAPITLTLVTSPFCYFCKQAHIDIHTILIAAKQNVKLIVRFNVDPTQKEKGLYKVVSELLHVYHTQGEAASLSLLNKLYAKDVDVSAWVKEQNIHYNPGYDMIMEQQHNWCTKHGINFTPALLVNDQKYPEEYNRTDLLYFIDDLRESMENNTPVLQRQAALAS